MAHKTVVSSSVMNLAGDTIHNFLKETIFASIFMEDSPQIGKDISKAIISSPGYKLRHYIYWLKNNKEGQAYCDAIGHYYTEFSADADLLSLAASFISATPIPEGKNISIETISIDDPDYGFWAEQYLYENYPAYLDEVNYDVTYSFDYANNKLITIKVKQNDSLIDTLTFNATDYNKDTKYLYAIYRPYELDSATDPVTGTVSYTEPENPLYEAAVYLKYAKNTPSSSASYNSGYSALFPQAHTPAQESTFMVPPIPFRLDNLQLSEAEEGTDEETLYKYAKKACYRATGKNATYRQIDKKILDNEDLNKLDYVYMVFGVSLNTKNWAGKQYLFNYMGALYQQYHASGSTQMIMKDREGRNNFQYVIKWTEIQHGTTNDIPDWMKEAFSGSEKYAVLAHEAPGNAGYLNNNCVWFLHKSGNQIEYYYAVGLIHYNYVKNGGSTKILGNKAFDYDSTDDGEVYRESSFIVPMHEGIFRSLPALVQAQLSQSFAYLLINAYEIKKVHWWQTGIFKIIFTIVLIVIATVITYFSAGTGSGSYAWATSFAAGLGIGGTAGAIFAALVTVLTKMVVAMVVSKLLVAGAKAIGLNDLIANIIGVVGSFFVNVGMDALNAYSSAAANASSLATSNPAASLNGIGESAGASLAEISNQSFGDFLLTSMKDGLYSLVTDARKLLTFSSQMFEAGFKGYTSDKMTAFAEEMEEKTDELQHQINRLEQMRQEMNTSWSEWSKQFMIWKIQTGITPENGIQLGLLTGTDVAKITLSSLAASLVPLVTVF